MDSPAEVQLAGLWRKMEFCRLGVGWANITSHWLTSAAVYLDHGNFSVYCKRFCTALEPRTPVIPRVPLLYHCLCPGQSFGCAAPLLVEAVASGTQECLSHPEALLPCCLASRGHRLWWVWQCLQPVPAGIWEGYASRQSSYNLPRGKFLPSAYLVHNKDVN